jgi:hypothetical protein
MMAVVPFIALVFAITGGLGLSGRLKDFMYSNFGGSESIDMILQSAQNIIDTAQSGGMGLLSALIFIWIIFTSIIIWIIIVVVVSHNFVLIMRLTK